MNPQNTAISLALLGAIFGLALCHSHPNKAVKITTISLSKIKAKNIFYLLLTAGFVASHFIIDEMEHIWPWLGTSIYRNGVQTFIALSIAFCLNRLL